MEEGRSEKNACERREEGNKKESQERGERQELWRWTEEHKRRFEMPEGTELPFKYIFISKYNKI